MYAAGQVDHTRGRRGTNNECWGCCSLTVCILWKERLVSTTAYLLINLAISDTLTLLGFWVSQTLLVIENNLLAPFGEGEVHQCVNVQHSQRARSLGHISPSAEEKLTNNPSIGGRLLSVHFLWDFFRHSEHVLNVFRDEEALGILPCLSVSNCQCLLPGIDLLYRFALGPQIYWVSAKARSKQQQISTNLLQNIDIRIICVASLSVFVYNFFSICSLFLMQSLQVWGRQ